MNDLKFRSRIHVHDDAATTASSCAASFELSSCTSVCLSVCVPVSGSADTLDDVAEILYIFPKQINSFGPQRTLHKKAVCTSFLLSNREGKNH